MLGRLLEMLFYKWDHELDHNWAHQLVRVLLVHMLGLKKEKKHLFKVDFIAKKNFQFQTNTKLLYC